MSYYLLQSDPKLHEEYLFVSKSPDGLNDGDWITGKKLESKQRVGAFVGDTKGTNLSDMVLTQFQLPIFSPKAVEVLEKAGVDLELFPVKIKHKKNKKVNEESYKMANILGLVNCLDKKHATLETFSGEPNRINYLRKYKIFEDKIPKKLKAFRLGEFTYHLLVHESVKEAWEAAGLTGAKFVATEKYT